MIITPKVYVQAYKIYKISNFLLRVYFIEIFTGTNKRVQSIAIVRNHITILVSFTIARASIFIATFLPEFISSENKHRCVSLTSVCTIRNWCHLPLTRLWSTTFFLFFNQLPAYVWRIKGVNYNLSIDYIFMTLMIIKTEAYTCKELVNIIP